MVVWPNGAKIKGNVMRTRFVAGVAASMLLVSGAALADDDLASLCYADPTAEECTGVGSESEEITEVDSESLEAEDEELDVQVLDTTEEAVAATGLAVTGFNTTSILAGALGLLLAGALMLRFARRRSPSSSNS